MNFFSCSSLKTSVETSKRLHNLVLQIARANLDEWVQQRAFLPACPETELGFTYEHGIGVHNGRIAGGQATNQ